MAKITEDGRHDIMYLFAKKGWRVMHLARKYEVSHASINYYTKALKREVQPIDWCPDDIVSKSAHMQRIRQNRPKKFMLYEDYLADEEKRRTEKRSSCGHDKIAIICLCCGQHFEETKTQNAKAKVVFL